MSETPKFTVIDRRKFKADEEQANRETAAGEAGAENGPEAKAEPVETLSVPLQVVPKREAPAVKLVMLDFHCEPAAVESCNKPKPAFLECHAA